jgi:NADH-quinone oxidoreductase subunit G
MAMSRLDKHATQFDKWSSEENKIDAKPSWEILQELASHFGATWRYQSAREIFSEIAQTVPALSGLDYKKLGKQGVKIEKVQGGAAVVA